MRPILILFLAAATSYAAHLKDIKVGGKGAAEVEFRLTDSTALPTVAIRENVLELTFNNTQIDKAGDPRFDLESPHILIHRLSAFRVNDEVVKGHVVLNGSLEGIKDRVLIEKVAGGVKLKVDLPKGENSALNLLTEEAKPLTEAARSGAGFGWGRMLALLVVLGVAAASAFFLSRFLKTRTKSVGSRKFLIEQLAYHSVGPRMGVSLLKVGREFVLVGVTPNQISLLSALPKLQEQYDEESRFDREVFDEAMKTEFRRTQHTRTTL